VMIQCIIHPPDQLVGKESESRGNHPGVAQVRAETS